MLHYISSRSNLHDCQRDNFAKRKSKLLNFEPTIFGRTEIQCAMVKCILVLQLKNSKNAGQKCVSEI